jgi:hypothetical protein
MLHPYKYPIRYCFVIRICCLFCKRERLLTWCVSLSLFWFLCGTLPCGVHLLNLRTLKKQRKIKAKPSHERINMESIHGKNLCIAAIMKSVVCFHFLSCKSDSRYCIYYEKQIKKNDREKKVKILLENLLYLTESTAILQKLLKMYLHRRV